MSCCFEGSTKIQSSNFGSKTLWVNLKLCSKILVLSLLTKFFDFEGDLHVIEMKFQMLHSSRRNFSLKLRFGSFSKATHCEGRTVEGYNNFVSYFVCDATCLQIYSCHCGPLVVQHHTCIVCCQTHNHNIKHQDSLAN